MPKLLSGFIPFTATTLAIAAFVLPARFVLDHLGRGASPDPSAIPETALATLLAALGLAYLGSVRWRDLERLENAWSVTTRVGCRSMPADRLRVSAGWGISTLFRERFWGRALNASAATLRWLVPALAIASLVAGAACLGLAAAGAWTPALIADLAIAPCWNDALLLTVPALLWPMARLHLPRLAHGAVPSDEQINDAQLAMVGRLTDPRIQAGAAAMSAVDHGLDGVFALAQRVAPQAARPAHDLAGLSDMPGELVSADPGR